MWEARDRAVLLREIEERVLRETRNVLECVVGVNAAGQVVFEKTGEPNRVGLTRDDLAALQGVALLTHNHPSGGGIGAGDFDVAALVDARELNAFGLEYRYRLFRPLDGWPAHRTVLAQVSAIRERVERRLRARVAAGSLSPGAASFGFWHNVWTEMTRQQPELHYVREKR